METRGLTAKEEAFVRAVVQGDGYSVAYSRAYNTENFKPQTLWSRAHELAKRPDVAAAIRLGQDQASQAAVFDAAAVLRDWVMIATADPSELSRTRKVCCRHCHGVGGAYQWRDLNEWLKASQRAAEQATEALGTEGGFGFKGNREPNPDCEACDGEGRTETWVADIHKVSASARKLYAGLKQTKDGIQILTRDQDGALKLIAQHFGLLTQKVQHSGVVGTVSADLAELSEPQKAALKSALQGLL